MLFAFSLSLSLNCTVNFPETTWLVIQNRPEEQLCESSCLLLNQTLKRFAKKAKQSHSCCFSFFFLLVLELFFINNVIYEAYECIKAILNESIF